MYSFVMNNNFRTNMPPAQLGDILFRYSVTSHKGNWIEGRPRDFGWAVKNPLIAVPVGPKEQGEPSGISQFLPGRQIQCHSSDNEKGRG